MCWRFYQASWLLLVFLLTITVQAGELVLDQGEEFKVLPVMEYLPVSASEDGAPRAAIASNPGFVPVTSGALPVSNRDVWYRFKINNRTGTTDEWVLDFSETLFDDIEIIYRSEGEWKSYRRGLIHPLTIRPIDTTHVAFPIKLPVGESTEVYLRIKTMHQPLVYPVLYSEKHYTHIVAMQGAISLIIIGVLLGITLFTVVTIYAANENKRLLAFALLIALLLMAIAYNNGLLFELVPESPQFHRVLYPYIMAATNIVFILFVRTLFDYPQWRPRCDILVRIYLLSFLMFPIVHFIWGLEPLPVYSNTASLVTVILMLLVGIDSYRQKIPSAKLYLVSLVLYLLPTIYTIMGAQGFIVYEQWAHHAYEFGALLLGVFLSLAIGQTLRESVRLKDETLSRALVVETREKMKSEFLAAMSHEIRTPINGVLGMAQLLQHTSQNETQSYYTDIIINSGKTLLTVINDILDLSKVEAGKFSLNEESLDLGKLLVYASTVFGANLRGKKIQFSYEISPEAPIYVIGDSVRLQQLISNLLANAAKFTREGSIDFFIEATTSPKDGRVTMRFTIRDTGVGISQQLQEKIFDPYTQEHNPDVASSSFHSTGLGLTICKELVELMGGSIHLQSELGQGSSFWFDIPMKIDQPLHDRFVADHQYLNKLRLGIYNVPRQHANSTADHFKAWGMEVIHLDGERLDLDAAPSLDLLMLLPTREFDLEGVFAQAKEKGIKVLVLMSPGVEQAEVSETYRAMTDFLRVPAGIGNFHEALCDLVRGRVAPDSVSSEQSETLLEPRLTRVLVVEDNLVNQKVVEAMLKKLDCDVIIAEDGRAGLQQYMKHVKEIDLVLMDCEMPIMDGYEATQGIRDYERTYDMPPVRIIALTAHALPVNTERCLASGMDSVLTKPLDMELLEAALDDLA